jgi:hypothetical protein
VEAAGIIREPSDFRERVRNPTIPYLPYPFVGHPDPVANGRASAGDGADAGGGRGEGEGGWKLGLSAAPKSEIPQTLGPAHDARGGGVDGLKKSTEVAEGTLLHSSAGRGMKALVGSVGVFILKSSL